MKRFTIFLAALLVSAGAFAQITLSTTFTASSSGFTYFYFNKFGMAGIKYVATNEVTKTITIYNLNNTVFKTVNIPSSITSAYYLAFISDDLFDLNNDIEYALVTYGGAGVSMKVHVFEESGTLLFSRDSANLGGSDFNSIMSQSGVFYTPAGVKMRLMIYANGSGPNPSKFEIYDLPGNMPCLTCSSTGTVTGISVLQGDTRESAVFYPNPAQQELKLRYTLPTGSTRADIEIHDVSGRLVERMEVSNQFDHVRLPASYNDGMYLYSLYVDGKLVKTEKVILSK